MEWTTETDCAYGATFTIGAAGATMTCTIQLTDFAGNALTVKNAVLIYATTDAAGNTIETLGAEAVVATHGICNVILATSCYLLVTENTGIVALTIDGDGATDTYINLVLPNGKVVTSGVMAFDS